MPRSRSWSRLLAVLALIGTTSTATAEIQVVDDLGQSVRLAAPAQRIVSLAPHITELVYAAGAGARLVGVVSYSDYPEAAKQLPIVGGYSRFDFERILALKPDLVVAWSSGNGKPQIDRLRELGLRVYVTEPRRMDDIATNLERLGALADSPLGAEAAARFRREYGELVEQYHGKSAVKVFYQIWDRPLMTVNGDHLISRSIELCGGVNLFADLTPLAGQVSHETVLARNPEALIGGGMDGARLEWFDLWTDFPDMEAVRQGNLFLIHPDLIQRHTPRILKGTRQLCENLEKVRQGRTRATGADSGIGVAK